MSIRFPSVVAFWLLLCLYGQAQDGYRILNKQGDVRHHVGGKVVPCEPGGYFLNGQSIELRSGEVSLLSDDLKRITLNEPGTYPFETVVGLFAAVKASLEGRFLEYIWREMKGDTGATSVPGGVFRGKSQVAFPPDSSFLLGDRLMIQLPSSKGVTDLQVISADGRLLLRLGADGRRVVVHRESAAWWKPGTYRIQRTTPPNAPLTTTFYIPDDAWIRQFQLDREWIRNVFGFNSQERLDRILAEYDDFRHVVR